MKKSMAMSLAVVMSQMPAAAGRAGFIAGALEWGGIGFACLVEDSAEEYANRIKAGE